MTRAYSLAAAFLALGVGAASAADLPRRSAPMPSTVTAPASVYNWTGVYVGANGGYAWGDVNRTNLNPAGFIGGGQIGANYQIGQFVVGAETDLMGTGASDSFAGRKYTLNYLGTLRGRAGVAFGNVLVYGTGGMAYGNGTERLPGRKDDNNHVGYAAGAGLEYGFTPNWTGRMEYLYTDLGNKSYNGSPTKEGFQGSIVRAGLNYKF